MTRFYFVRTSLLVTLLLSTQAWGLTQFSSLQKDTAIELVEKLEQRHYSQQKLNDELSTQLLDNYLENLDPGRLFFYQSDISEFEKYRFKLDDQFRRGNLQAGAEIFERYQIRNEQRLTHILESLEENIATMDFSVDESISLDRESTHWANSQKEVDERWRLTLKNQVLSLKVAGKEDSAILETITKRYKNQLRRLKQLNQQDAFQIYANSLTELFDPHTNYFSPRRTENFNINMSLSLEGIGAVLQAEDEYTKVVRLIAAGPADKQGELQPSDKIIAVGQGNSGELEDVIGWRLDEVVELIRGPKGSTVRLEVIPSNAQTPDQRKVIAIERNKVKLEEQSAQKSIIEVNQGDGKVKLGVIDIPTFYIDFAALQRNEPNYKSTTRDVKKLLDELLAEGVEGIIIDLRGNGGGSLQEANNLTGLFIEYGPTVQVRSSSNRVFRDGKRVHSNFYDGPLAVVVNRLSASASEIFAGAIQDYQRGIIVGSQSFGKGTVQSLVSLTEGQLKITESKFYRISGESTQHRGVMPDINFPALYDTEDVGESSLEHALNWDKINPIRHKTYSSLPNYIPSIAKKSQIRTATNPDFIFMEERMQLAENAEAITELPLNENVRKAFTEQQKQKGLDIENKRRLAKGLKPLSDFDKPEDQVQTEKEAQDKAEEKEEEDALLKEAGHILLDSIVFQNQKVAANAAK